MFSIIQPLLYKTCRSLEGSSCNSLETTYILFKLPQVYVSQRRTHSQVFSIVRFYHKLQTYNKIWILKVRPKVNNLISIKCTHILVFFQFYIRLSNKPWRQISYLVQICKYLLGALLLFSNSSLTILNYYKGHIISKITLFISNITLFQRLNISYSFFDGKIINSFNSQSTSGEKLTSVLARKICNCKYFMDTNYNTKQMSHLRKKRSRAVGCIVFRKSSPPSPFPARFVSTVAKVNVPFFDILKCEKMTFDM